MPSTPEPTSPEDPEWVDAIVARALQRSGSIPTAPQPSLPVDGPPKATPVSPVRPQRAPQPMPAPDIFAVDDTDLADPHVDQHGDDRPTFEAPGDRTIVSAPADTWPEVGAGSAAGAPYPDEARAEAAGDSGRPAHRQADRQPVEHAVSHRVRTFLEWGAVIVGTLAVALLIKTFLMQAYYIPSGSMQPTLDIGDRLLVNKLSYEFGEIDRGDLVVFHRPAAQIQGEDDLIKRVIGLSGETVEIRDGQVFITPVAAPQAQLLREPYLPEGTMTAGFTDTSNCASFTETSCVVPDDHVFVMGDNRSGSRDSRVFGPIPEDLVVGRAFLRVWPLGDIDFL